MSSNHDRPLVYVFGQKIKEGKNKGKYRDNVHVLSPDDFKGHRLVNETLKKGYTTVMIYSNSCGHCITAKPVYANMSLKSSLQSNTAALDCTNSEQDNPNENVFNNINEYLKSKNKPVIYGFPTFIRFKDGLYDCMYESSATRSITRLKKDGGRKEMKICIGGIKNAEDMVGSELLYFILGCKD
jgi:thiol-disulfide isomerase/thioredoxin